MRGRFVASLTAAVLIASAGVVVGSTVPVAAVVRMPVAAGASMRDAPLSPKLRALVPLIARGSGAPALPQLASSIPCNSIWNAIEAANPGTTRNGLTGIAALAPNDIWAVGFFLTGSSAYETLAEHWDGSAWSMVTTPNVGTGNNLLTAVTAIGPRDVWAVGYWRPGDSSTGAQPLTEHWDGNSWTVIGAPVVPNTSTYLNAVSGDASNDVWAVGISINFPVGIEGPRGHAFAIHWTGSAWSIVPTAALVAPIAGPGVDLVGLNGVKVLSPNSTWAVGDGQDFSGSTPVSPDMSFIEHWNGSSWSQISSPTHPNGDFLSDVQGTASDLWAVGGLAQSAGSSSDNVLIEHWTGASWTDVPGFTPGLSANLLALGYLSSTNVYAVGASASSNPGTSLETDNTVIEQWNGSTWSQVTSANPTISQGLFAIAAVSANDIWTAGFLSTSSFEGALTENFCAPPAVTSIAPSSGDAGNTVVIRGSGFSRAIAVDFGATPTFSFHVDSDTQITAISPGHKAGIVDVTVTVQGTSATSSSDQFTYVFARDSGTQQPIAAPFRSRATPPTSKLAAAMSAINRALVQFIAG